MKTLFLIIPLLLVGCAEVYRYPCQDPANADKAECNRPACEAEGYCYDTLNGLPPETQIEETPAATAADCNCNTENETGE